jgi:nucleoside-diphosphate-sugar epimerase
MAQSSETHVVLGTGPLGRAVASELLRKGQRVRIVNRSGVMADAPAGAEVRSGDLYDPNVVRAITQDAAVVYNAAQPGYTEWVEKFPPLVDSILKGMTGSKAPLIFGDNLYMYGPVKGAIHEDLPNKAATRKGRVRGQLADTLLAADKAGRVRVAIGRGSDFFGPWAIDSLYGERLFKPAMQGKAAQMVGNLDMPHTATYTGDFGRALVTLGENESALGQVWHVPNDTPTLTQRQFVNLVFEELGGEPRMSSAGPLMMRMLGLFVPVLREVSEMMYEFTEPFVVDSSKFERSYGFKATPIREAIGETVAWYRTHEGVVE